MGSHTCDLTVIQYDDLVRMADSGSSLGYDKGRGLIFQSPDCCTEFCIRCVVQCGGTVIQDQDLRLSDQGSRNGQTLSLSTGEILTVLCHSCIQLTVLALYHFRCLCKFQCFPHFLFCSIRFAPLEITADRSLEQNRLLRYDTDTPTQLLITHGLDISAFQQDLALCRRVEAGNQVHQRGLTGTGTSDDTYGIATVYGEVHILQSRCTGSLISQGYMFEV